MKEEFFSYSEIVVHWSMDGVAADHDDQDSDEVFENRKTELTTQFYETDEVRRSQKDDPQDKFINNLKNGV